MNITTGIVDIHHDDGAFDLAAAQRAGLVALIHKASQGKDWHDPGFDAAMDAAHAAGLLVGAYHFGSDSSPGEVQADFFLRTVGHDITSALLALDLEHNPDTVGGTMSTTNAALFVRRVHDATNRWPVLYAGLSDLRARIKAAAPDVVAVLANCPLWLAAYGPDPRALAAPAPWASWTLHQYTNGADGPTDATTFPRRTPGFARQIQDRSCFRGTADELRAWWATRVDPS